MISDLNRFYPRKRKPGTKSGGSGARDGSSTTEKQLQSDEIISQCYQTDTLTLFGRQAGLLRDIFIKSIRLSASVSSLSLHVTIDRAYRETSGSIRYEDCNISAEVLLPECILHISDVYLSETFGLKLELTGGWFLVDTAGDEKDLLTVDGYFGRTVRAQVRGK